MRVGTRKTYSNIAPVDKDHPHACGDKLRMSQSTQDTQGSSPCVWGQALQMLLMKQ